MSSIAYNKGYRDASDAVLRGNKPDGKTNPFNHNKEPKKWRDFRLGASGRIS